MIRHLYPLAALLIVASFIYSPVWSSGNPVVQEFLREHREHAEIATATTLWLTRDIHEPVYWEGVLEGLRAVDEEHPLQLKDENELAEEYEAKRWALRAKENLTASDTYFESLNEDELECSIQNRLYYQTVFQGDGPRLDLTYDSATLTYSVMPIQETFDPRGDCCGLVFGEVEEKLRLCDLIPGLAHGICGMQIGEVRELYIHSLLAYGTEGMFEPGVSFRATVKLVDIGEQAKEPLVLDLSDHEVPSAVRKVTPEAVEQCCYETGCAYGYHIGTKIRGASDLCSLHETIRELSYLTDGGEPKLSQDEAFSVFSRLYWLIGYRCFVQQ